MKLKCQRLCKAAFFLIIIFHLTYNWEPLVLGPEFAMESTPRPVWVSCGLNSSSNFLPQMDSPPEPLPVGSPP